jgi:hypothetical protein
MIPKESKVVVTEAQRSMTSRKLLNVAFKSFITLALLVLMMTPPLRVSNSTTYSTLRPQLKPTASISTNHSPVIRAPLVLSRAVPIKAIQSENEEHRLSEPFSTVLFFLVVSPVSSFLSPSPNLASSGLRIANQPLRC